MIPWWLFLRDGDGHAVSKNAQRALLALGIRAPRRLRMERFKSYDAYMAARLDQEMMGGWA